MIDQPVAPAWRLGRARPLPCCAIVLYSVLYAVVSLSLQVLVLCRRPNARLRATSFSCSGDRPARVPFKNTVRCFNSVTLCSDGGIKAVGSLMPDAHPVVSSASKRS